MAADPSLSLDRVSKALHAFFNMLSNPETLPEFPAIQVQFFIAVPVTTSWIISAALRH